MAKEIRCDYVQFIIEIQKIGSDGILCVAKIWRKILEMATSNINFNNILDKFKFALQFFWFATISNLLEFVCKNANFVYFETKIWMLIVNLCFC